MFFFMTCQIFFWKKTGLTVTSVSCHHREEKTPRHAVVDTLLTVVSDSNAILIQYPRRPRASGYCMLFVSLYVIRIGSQCDVRVASYNILADAGQYVMKTLAFCILYTSVNDLGSFEELSPHLFPICRIVTPFFPI